MPVCEICNQEKPQGYRVNPRTGSLEPSRFWCDEHYERIVALTARQLTENSESKLRRGRTPGAGDR
jgi:hypothetical protein